MRSLVSVNVILPLVYSMYVYHRSDYTLHLIISKINSFSLSHLY